MKKLFSLLTTALIAASASLGVFAADDAAKSGGADVSDTLMLMLQGMLGIFVVMGLIYLVVVILNKVSAPKKQVKDDTENGK